MLLHSRRREEVAAITCGHGKSELRSQHCGRRGRLFSPLEQPSWGGKKMGKGILKLWWWHTLHVLLSAHSSGSGNCLGHMNSTDIQKGILGNKLGQNYQKLLKICFFWPLTCGLFKFYILKGPKNLNWIKFLIRRLLPKWRRMEFKLKMGRSRP